MPAPQRPRLPISPRTLGLILLVLVAALAPLLRPPEHREAPPRSRERPRETAPGAPGTTTQTPTSVEPRLSYTKHGRERFAERRISEEDALDVLVTPDRREHEKPGEDGGEVYKYSGRVGDRTLVIVAETQGDRHTIITGYWDD